MASPELRVDLRATGQDEFRIGTTVDVIAGDPGQVLLVDPVTPANRRNLGVADLSLAGSALFDAIATPGAPVDGQAWYEAANGFQFREGGVTKGLGNPAAGALGEVQYSDGAGGFAASPNLTFDPALGSGGLNVANTTASTNSTNGAFVVAGGVGVGGDVYASGKGKFSRLQIASGADDPNTSIYSIAFNGGATPHGMRLTSYATQVGAASTGVYVLASTTQGGAMGDVRAIIGDPQAGGNGATIATTIGVEGRAGSALAGDSISSACGVRGTTAVAAGGSILSAYSIYGEAQNAGSLQNYAGFFAGIVHIGDIPGTHTKANGDVWYSAGSNQLFGRINGADVDLGQSGTFSGGIANQQVAFGTGVDTIGGSNDLTWDAATMNVAAATAATNPSTGAFVTAGGIGVAGDGWFGGGLNAAAYSRFTSTDALGIPVGTTAQRPVAPVDGDIRVNTTDGSFEGYRDGAWRDLETVPSGGQLLVAPGSTTGVDNLATTNQGALAAATSGSRNVAIGRNAADAVTTGGDNVIVGDLAGRGNTITRAVMVGALAGGAIGSTGDNVFVGYSAGGEAATNQSSGDVYIGAYAGRYGRNGSNVTDANIAIGFTALQGSATPASNTGRSNIAIGYQAGLVIANGSDNVAVGMQALVALVSGVDNVAVGKLAGATLLSGSDNVFVGDGADGVQTTANAVGIGANAFAGGASAIALGQGAVASASRSVAIGQGVNNAVANRIHIGNATDHVFVQSSTVTTSPTTGALVVTGGVGIGGRVRVGSTENATLTSDGQTITGGSITTPGGIAVDKDIALTGGSKINLGSREFNEQFTLNSLQSEKALEIARFPGDQAALAAVDVRISGSAGLSNYQRCGVSARAGGGTLRGQRFVGVFGGRVTSGTVANYSHVGVYGSDHSDWSTIPYGATPGSIRNGWSVGVAGAATLVDGNHDTNVGVYGYAAGEANNWAGYFEGDVQVGNPTGNALLALDYDITTPGANTAKITFAAGSSITESTEPAVGDPTAFTIEGTGPLETQFKHTDGALIAGYANNAGLYRYAVNRIQVDVSAGVDEPQIIFAPDANNKVEIQQAFGPTLQFNGTGNALNEKLAYFQQGNPSFGLYFQEDALTSPFPVFEVSRTGAQPVSLRLQTNQASTSATTGGLVVDAGLGLTGDLFQDAGGRIYNTFEFSGNGTYNLLGGDDADNYVRTGYTGSGDTGFVYVKRTNNGADCIGIRATANHQGNSGIGCGVAGFVDNEAAGFLNAIAVGIGGGVGGTNTANVQIAVMGKTSSSRPDHFNDNLPSILGNNTTAAVVGIADKADPTAIGVYGTASAGTTVNWAGYFEGDARVTGDLHLTDGADPSAVDLWIGSSTTNGLRVRHTYDSLLGDPNSSTITAPGVFSLIVGGNSLGSGGAGLKDWDFVGSVGSDSEIDATSYEVNGTKVVGDQATGWGAPTGTATRTTFATSTVTLEQLAERLKALIDDLTSHGLIGT